MKYKHTNVGKEPMGFYDKEKNFIELRVNASVILDHKCSYNYLDVEKVIEKVNKKRKGDEK